MSTKNVHIHYDTYTADCDGPHESHGTYQAGHRVTMDRALENLITDNYHACDTGPSTHAHLGAYCDPAEHDRTLAITTEIALDNGVPRVAQYVVTAHGPSEESANGWTTQYRVCDDDCDTGPTTRWVRDVFAENAGM